MISYMARHPTASNLLMIVMLAAGVLSLPDIQRETMPDRGSDEVQIVVVYPGATADDVEESICQRIEDALDGVRFMDELRSDARESVATVVAKMEEGEDIKVFLDEVRAEVEAIDDLPENAEEPVITQLGTKDPVLSVLVSGPMDSADLKVYCEDFKDRLRRDSEVTLVTINGFPHHELRVELSANQLRRHGLSVQQVAGKIGSQNVSVPAGDINSPDQDILIRVIEERRTVRELKDIVIRGEVGGAEIKLGDIARIRDMFDWRDGGIVTESATTELRGAAEIKILKTKNQDSLRIADAVKKFVDDERARRPQLDLRITQDSSVLVRSRLEMLIKNGCQGMVLVFAVLWLFFNVKLSFWVAMSLPVSFLGAFFFLPILGLTINMLTMVGLLLALGLLMDDGIVIAENIATHRATGKSAMQSAIDGINEVKAGVFSSFLTTVCVLGPLVNISGEIGKVLKVVPMMLILVMAISLIEAFCILPAHLGHALHGESKTPGRFRRLFDGWIEAAREYTGRFVDVAVRWRYLTVGLTLMVFLLSASLFVGGILRFQGFPDLDGDVIVARVLLPQGTPPSRTHSVVSQVTDALDQVNAEFKPRQPDEQDLIENVMVQFNVNTEAFESGPHVATVTVDLLDAEIRNGRVDDVIQAWRAKVGSAPDVLSLAFSEPSFGPSGRPIEVRLAGDDLSELQTAAADLESWFNQFTGVFNVASDLRPGRPEIRLRLLDGATALGLDASTIAQQLRGAFQGQTADEIQVGPESFDIEVRLAYADYDSLDDFERFDFTLNDGTLVPLLSVVSIEHGSGWSRIARVDGQRVVTVRGDLDARVANTASIFREFNASKLAELNEAYPGIRVSLQGEMDETGTTMSSMQTAMAIGFLGVFVLLSFQFHSYIEPLIVMIAIPLSLIGVIWGHMAMGVELSMPSMMGFISLSGVVVNDSILLVLFIKNARTQGASAEEAATQSSRQRFRAILLTSLTTIAGLLPLLAERSLQAQILIPLAISIAFGMLASTVLVLVVIPCVYVILADFGLLAKQDGSTSFE